MAYTMGKTCWSKLLRLGERKPDQISSQLSKYKFMLFVHKFELRACDGPLDF